jgi:drug/metabolite transporter (DMT)-like permease
MFVGEALCLVVYYIGLYVEKWRKAPETGYHSITVTPGGETPVLSETTPLVAPTPIDLSSRSVEPLAGLRNLLLWLPTLCDMTATTLMNVGLIYISASIYQMLRGSVVLFTGTLSVWFLGRKHPIYRWFALVMVFVGVAIVGLSSVVGPAVELPGTSPVPEPTLPPPRDGVPELPIPPEVIGVAMVVLAQIFTATQFVIEEKIMSRYELPAIKAVGLEGLFGLLSLGILMPTLYYTVGKDTGNYFDLVVGWHEIINHTQVLVAGVGIIFSIAFFNWFGLSVTRNISATSRSTIDTCRTLFIWMISLSLGWETFKFLQVVGFVVLLYGTFLFNDVVRPPPLAFCQKVDDDHDGELVSDA